VSLIFRKQNHPPRDYLTENSHSYDLVNPRFYYREFVLPITEKLLTSIESGLECLSLEYDWDYPIDPDVWSEEWEGIGAYFNLDFSVMRKEYPSCHPGWNLNGFSGWGSPGASIELELSASPDLDLSLMRVELHPEIVNVVAHEIHHLTQYGAPFQRPGCPSLKDRRQSLTHYQYFSSNIEVPAFLVGFRAESDVTGNSIEYSMNEYLLKQVAASIITGDEKEFILEKWLSHSFGG